MYLDTAARECQQRNKGVSDHQGPEAHPEPEKKKRAQAIQKANHGPLPAKKLDITHVDAFARLTAHALTAPVSKSWPATMNMEGIEVSPSTLQQMVQPPSLESKTAARSLMASIRQRPDNLTRTARSDRRTTRRGTHARAHC